MSTYWGDRNIDNKTEWDKRARYTGVTQGVGVIDSRHHLKDNVPLYFGYDSDFSIRYDSSANGLTLSSVISSSSDTFFSIQNVDTEVFGVSDNGEVKLKVQNILPAVPSQGRLIYFNGFIYYSDNE